MKPRRALQLGFSNTYADAAFDAASRKRKAQKVLAILEDCLEKLDHLELLDIGCSTGFMSQEYAKRFKSVVAVDVDAPAVIFAANHTSAPNIEWLVMDSQQTGFKDVCFDVITCTHIYEHVPDAERLMAEIYRLLKPGGVCFFSAGNRFSLIEPHYGLPLLSVMPKWMAHRYLRLLRRGGYYYENHRSYWGLKKLIANFKLIDYTRIVVEQPERFHADDLVKANSLNQKIILGVLRVAYWACPTYLWVLRKPSQSD